MVRWQSHWHFRSVSGKNTSFYSFLPPLASPQNCLYRGPIFVWTIKGLKCKCFLQPSGQENCIYCILMKILGHPGKVYNSLKVNQNTERYTFLKRLCRHYCKSQECRSKSNIASIVISIHCKLICEKENK